MRQRGDGKHRGKFKAISFLLRLETDCAPSSDLVLLHTLTQELSLYGNQIGDDGMRSLADAFAKGALAQVTFISLSSNNIGDDGLNKLAEALRKGALPALETLFVQEVAPALEAACEAHGVQYI